MFFAFLALIAICFGVGSFFGAPYVPAHRRDAEAALDLAELKAGETFLDIGCGDGKLLRAAAKRGAYAIGYEINPIVWLVAWIWCLPRRKHISVRYGNFWQHRMPEADVVFIFLIRHYMKRLERKLDREVKPGARVVSYVFDLPTRKPDGETATAKLYKY